MASMASLIFFFGWINLPGWLGLIHWGIVIHRFIDGYSHLITGLHASDNNTGQTVLDVFQQAASTKPSLGWSQCWKYISSSLDGGIPCNTEGIIYMGTVNFVLYSLFLAKRGKFPGVSIISALRDYGWISLHKLVLLGLSIHWFGN